MLRTANLGATVSYSDLFDRACGQHSRTTCYCLGEYVGVHLRGWGRVCSCTANIRYLEAMQIFMPDWVEVLIIVFVKSDQ